MARLVVHCLHGSLQTPGVWSGFDRRLAGHLSRPVHVVAEVIDPPPEGGAPAWADGFCRRMAHVADARGGGGGLHRVLLGYSLGGRLAMHALLACPGPWSAAVLIAAHPGGGDAAERRAVRRRDAAWAKRCRRERWDSLLAEWDGLPVFGGRPNRAPRSPEDLDRERCARMFEAFSRGDHADLRVALAETPIPPVLYVTGADDGRYRALGLELAALVPSFTHAEVVDAGHRVPWDRPAAFTDTVGGFLQASLPVA